MEFLHCPHCRTLRMYHNGKCQTCGYISSKRNSINALYGSKGIAKSASNQGFSNGRKPGGNCVDGLTTVVVTSAIYSSDSCSSSSSSDGGSSGCD